MDIGCEKMPVISVLIPCYNAEKYITECLDSVLYQTYKDFEIIVADDGSTDSSAEILDRYALKYENIIVYHKENEGLFKTRAFLIDKAKGEYIAWIDSDDLMKPDCLENSISAALENDADVVYYNYDFYPEKVAAKAKWYRPYTGQKDWHLVNRNDQWWNKLVKRTLIERLGIAEKRGEAGEGIYALTLICAEKIVSIDTPLMYYRVGQESMSGSYGNTKHYCDDVNRVKKLYKCMKSYKLSGYWDNYFAFYVIYSLYLVLIVSARNGEKKIFQTARSYLKKYIKRNDLLVKEIMDENFGKLRSFVIRNILPINYYCSNMIVSLALSK